MKDYVELLTSERAALAEKYRAKPRCATLREVLLGERHSLRCHHRHSKLRR
jgi:hypothetical protein